MRYIIFFLIFFYPSNIFASSTEQIKNKLKETNNMSFKFIQKIGKKTEKGDCIISYPKKILCKYDDIYNNKVHLGLTYGKIDNKKPVLIRVHSECLTGDIFHSLRCDCGSQLDFAMKKIVEKGSGIIVYLRQEGRGIGLRNKIKAYKLQQEKNLDTVEANNALGFKADLRDYGVGAQILKDLGAKELIVMTNNPKKLIGLEGHDLKIADRVSINIDSTEHNEKYLSIKKTKLNHILD